MSARFGYQAYGLAIDASHELAGLRPGAGLGRPVQLDIVPAGQIQSLWPTEEATVIAADGAQDAVDGMERTIESHPEAGYRLHARHFGTALVTRDGRQVLCSPDAAAAWDWQRFLIARVLPWVAVLHELEPFHASAVTLGGEAVAVLAASGGGKTSIALQLLLRGASFLTDDVAAVELRAGRAVLHPGPALAAVRDQELQRLRGADIERLGRQVGAEGKTYLEIRTCADTAPLGTMVFLEPGSRLEVHEVSPDPRLLLTSTFVFALRGVERRLNHLDVCAAVASTARFLKVGIPPEAGSEATGEALYRALV